MTHPTSSSFSLSLKRCGLWILRFEILRIIPEQIIVAKGCCISWIKLQ